MAVTTEEQVTSAEPTRAHCIYLAVVAGLAVALSLAGVGRLGLTAATWGTPSVYGGLTGLFWGIMSLAVGGVLVVSAILSLTGRAQLMRTLAPLSIAVGAPMMAFCLLTGRPVFAVFGLAAIVVGFTGIAAGRRVDDEPLADFGALLSNHGAKAVTIAAGVAVAEVVLAVLRLPYINFPVFFGAVSVPAIIAIAVLTGTEESRGRDAWLALIGSIVAYVMLASGLQWFTVGVFAPAAFAVVTMGRSRWAYGVLLTHLSLYMVLGGAFFGWIPLGMFSLGFHQFFLYFGLAMIFLERPTLQSGPSREAHLRS